MKYPILLVIAVIFFQSCSKEDTETTQNQESLEKTFYALEVGNSWVYKNYFRNQLTGNFDFSGVIDSISIIGTEEVNDKVYYKSRRLTSGNDVGYPFCFEDGEYFELVRDSIGFLVTDSGKIKYARDNYDERIVSVLPYGIIFEKLQINTYTANVEAGSFVCLDTERFLKDTNNQQRPGLDHYYYSNGIGLVFSTLSTVSNPIHTFERRLDTYFIQ